MRREIRQIVADVDGLTLANADDLDRLQGLADEYFSSADALAHLDVWFRLYERFPESDGHGVFWTILHGIEAQPGYEASVVASVRRTPTHFPVLMVNCMLNGGVTSAGGVDLLGLLQSVAANDRCPASVRQDAERFLEYQRH